MVRNVFSAQQPELSFYIHLSKVSKEIGANTTVLFMFLHQHIL